MNCIFTEKDNKIQIGIRKVLQLKRTSKKSAGKLSVSYYIPIYKDEAERLRLTHESLVKVELSLLPARYDDTHILTDQKSMELEPAHEAQIHSVIDNRRRESKLGQL